MIVPDYNKYDIPYFYDFDDKGLCHSYQIEPPGYSQPQILYKFHYEGIVDKMNNIWLGPKYFNWIVNPPFFILSGQGTREIIIELQPKLVKEREPIKTGPRKLVWRDLNYCELNVKILKWEETLNLYYRQGPLWKIEGNTLPKVNTIETYTFIPQYNQTGYPPKYTTDPNSYSFVIRNGKNRKFYGQIPPIGNPKIDIYWYSTGPSYLSFYSSWTNETLKFPNTLPILVVD